MRVLAASLVLFSHQFPLMGRPEMELMPRVSPGTLGVCIFFAISGFLVAQSWERDPNVWRFAARRFLRIWPGLTTVTLLAALVLGPLVSTLSAADYFRADGTLGYFKTLLLNIKYELPGVFTANPYPLAVNGSLWTIPVEVRWYFVILLAGLTGALKFRPLVLASSVGFAVYYLGIYGAETNPEPIYFQEYGLFFLYGTCLHLFRDTWTQHPRAATGIVAAAALAASLLGHRFVALWLALPYLVIAFGVASTPALRRFGRFGDLSYGIYIYAFPVQQLVVWSTAARYSLPVTMLISAATTAALAFASWHLIEEPAMRLRPGRPYRKKLERQFEASSKAMLPR